MSSFHMAFVLALALTPVVAQAGSTSSEAPSKSAPAQAKSALDVPIEAIAASVSGCAVLDKDFPGMRSHAMYGFFKSMSLHQVAALSKGKMTPAMLAQARADLAPLAFAAVPPPAALPDIDDMETAANSEPK
jgi:hypothetical protein